MKESGIPFLAKTWNSGVGDRGGRRIEPAGADKRGVGTEFPAEVNVAGAKAETVGISGPEARGTTPAKAAGGSTRATERVASNRVCALDLEEL